MTLAIDIGGTGVKAAVLDPQGVMLVDRVKIDTPVGYPPGVLITAVATLTRQLPPFGYGVRPGQLGAEALDRFRATARKGVRIRVSLRVLLPRP